MEPFALLQTLRVPYFPRVASNFRSNGNNPARAVQRIILINKVNARFSLPFQLPPIFPYYPTFRKTSSSKQFTNHPLKKKDLSPTLSSIKIYIIRNIHTRSSDKEWYDWIKSDLPSFRVTSFRSNFPIIRSCRITSYFAGIRHLSTSFIRDLTRDDWPGNGREPSTSEITCKHLGRVIRNLELVIILRNMEGREGMNNLSPRREPIRFN